MTQARTPLPDFARPPVVEVALTVQFEPLRNLMTPHIGFLWERFRDRFPRVEEHPPLGTMAEWFGAPTPRIAEPRIEFSQKPPMARCWFISESGTQVIQVQQDRFTHNWRKEGDGDSYPRYPHIRATFEREVTAFHDFLREQKLGDLRPNLCEVTYFNHITAGTGWARHGQLDAVCAPFTAAYSDPFLPEAEDANLNLRFQITDDHDKPIGRLHIAVEAAHRRNDNLPIYLLTLTARGRPITEDVAGVLNFLDLGREWVVRGFASITTPGMHEIWGRHQ